jgi:hypothetical protein
VIPGPEEDGADAVPVQAAGQPHLQIAGRAERRRQRGRVVEHEEIPGPQQRRQRRGGAVVERAPARIDVQEAGEAAAARAGRRDHAATRWREGVVRRDDT